MYRTSREKNDYDATAATTISTIDVECLFFQMYFIFGRRLDMLMHTECRNIWLSTIFIREAIAAKKPLDCQRVFSFNFLFVCLRRACVSVCVCVLVSLVSLRRAANAPNKVLLVFLCSTYNITSAWSMNNLRSFAVGIGFWFARAPLARNRTPVTRHGLRCCRQQQNTFVVWQRAFTGISKRQMR